MAQPTVIIEFIQKNKENGAPGMQPNLYKVVYYQWLIDVLFWKSGPESGPGVKRTPVDNCLQAIVIHYDKVITRCFQFCFNSISKFF